MAEGKVQPGLYVAPEFPCGSIGFEPSALGLEAGSITSSCDTAGDQSAVAGAPEARSRTVSTAGVLAATVGASDRLDSAGRKRSALGRDWGITIHAPASPGGEVGAALPRAGGAGGGAGAVDCA